jgi:hypothetical protein
LVKYEFSFSELSGAELAAFDACAAIFAFFHVLNGNVFRGCYGLGYVETDEGRERVAAA